MAKYRFYQEYTITRKMREYYDIEAESIEDARKLVEGYADLDDCIDANFNNVEEVFPENDRDFRKGIITIYDSTGEEIE